MLTSYRRVLAVPGALGFTSAGLLARLPIAMASLGIVVLVSARTGSYRLAGSIAGAYLVGSALFAVVQGRLTDRLGQTRVLRWTVLAYTLALATLMWSVEAGWSSPWPHLLAAAGGACFPQIGSCVRARWSHNLPDKVQLQTAFALEAVLDEVVFVVGPILVTLLATAIDPAAGLATALAAGLVGTLALAAQRSTAPPAHPRHQRDAPAARMPWGVLAALTSTAVALGVVFGGTEVATVAFTDELGTRGAAGPLLALLALGSMLAGFASGLLRWRWSNPARVRAGMAVLAALLVPLPFVDGLLLMGLFLFLAGLAVAPTLIAAIAWTEETVPAGRLTEGISILTTGLYVGLAPGAALVGAVVDRQGASASYWVATAAAATGALAGLVPALLPSRAARPRDVTTE